MKSTDSVIVSWDFSHGKDVGVLIVGKQKKGKVEIINAYQGEENKMSDVLVVKVNMFCRSRELNDIRRYILSQIENGKVVVLPAYCDAQIVPDDIEIRVEDLFGDKSKGDHHYGNSYTQISKV